MKHTITKTSLEIGSPVLLIDTPGAASFQFNAVVRGGFNYTPKKYHEMPHLLEHLAFEGNQEYPTGQLFANAVDDIGAYRNATTNDYIIRYYIEAGVDNIERIVDLGSSILLNPLFREEDIGSQKQVITSELSRNIQSDSFRCGYEMYRRIYGDQPDLLQRIDSMKHTNRQRIREYFTSTHNTKNTFFVVAGDLKQNRAKLLDLMNIKLSGYTKGPQKSLNYRKPKHFKKELIYQKAVRSDQTNFIFSMICPEYQEQLDSVLRVFNTMLNGSEGSRMFRQIRDAGLSYGIKTARDIDKTYSYFEISDGVENDKAAPLLEMSLRIFGEVLNGDFSDEELDRAKGFSVGRLRLSHEAPRHLGDWYGGDFVAGEKLESPDQYIKKIQKVTRQDILSLKEKFFHPDHWLLSVVSKDQNTIDQMHKVVADKYQAIF